jgi:hypothetical protein
VPTRSSPMMLSQQHVSLFPAETGSRDRDVDGPPSGVFGRFFDIRTDTHEMHCPARGDDRALEQPILQESNAARTFMLHSMPVPVMMPSLIAAWGSPKKTSASSTRTGR